MRQKAALITQQLGLSRTEPAVHHRWNRRSCSRRVLSGLTAAMFLFIVASGLSLIFGVLRVLNFAHGSFYMLGAYMAWQITHWLGARHGQLLARGARRRRSRSRCSAA